MRLGVDMTKYDLIKMASAISHLEGKWADLFKIKDGSWLYMESEKVNCLC